MQLKKRKRGISRKSRLSIKKLRCNVIIVIKMWRNAIEEKKKGNFNKKFQEEVNFQ